LKRSKINEIFSKHYPGIKTPHYKIVKKEHPYLFLKIMEVFGGYRAFCRATHRKYPRTSPREAAFIKFSQSCSRRWHYNHWSSLEELTWMFLEYLDVADDFIHNCPFPGPKSGRCRIDFYNPFTQKRIETDGPFHKMTKKADAKKDKWFASFGIESLHITAKEFDRWDLVIKKILNFL